MKTFSRYGLAATAVLMATCAAVAQPVSQPGRNSPPGIGSPGDEKGTQMLPRSTPEQRVAKVKEGLKLTDAQQKNWPAFEKALRDRITLRRELRDARKDGGDEWKEEGADLLANQKKRVEMLAKRADDAVRLAASEKSFVTALDPLYQSLDSTQKEEIAKLLHLGPRRENDRDRVMNGSGGPGPNGIQGPGGPTGRGPDDWKNHGGRNEQGYPGGQDGKGNPPPPPPPPPPQR